MLHIGVTGYMLQTGSYLYLIFKVCTSIVSPAGWGSRKTSIASSSTSLTRASHLGPSAASVRLTASSLWDWVSRSPLWVRSVYTHSHLLSCYSCFSRGQTRSSHLKREALEFFFFANFNKFNSRRMWLEAVLTHISLNPLVRDVNMCGGSD